MVTQREKAERFKALHEREGAFVIPNPWDAGSARLLEGFGFEALATTSAGFANSLGRLDGQVTRDEVIEHCRSLSATTELPVSADLENCFADNPAEVGETIRLGALAGLVGGSIEDYGGGQIYDFNADVLYAPGLKTLDEVRLVAGALTKPVNVLAPLLKGMTVAQLADAGARRISVGGALARAALTALLRACAEIRMAGSFAWASDLASSAEVTGLLGARVS